MINAGRRKTRAMSFVSFRRKPVVLLCATVFLLLMMAGCGSLYKVKPVVEAPLPKDAPTDEDAILTLRAVPLVADEESQELFEANMPLAGLLPVRVEMVNKGSAPVEMERARFRLRDAEGRLWKFRTARDAASRILSNNKITLYNPNARAKFEEALRAYAFDTKRPLAPGERRQGLIFFQTPEKEAVANPRGLVLVIERLPQPLAIRLN